MNATGSLRTFYDALPGLIEAGTSLDDLYREMCSVPDRGEVRASSADLRVLATVWTQVPTFLPIRLAELFGGLRVEHSDDYVLALVGGLRGWRWGALLTYVLRHDHDLREQVFWRVFEVEGGGQVSLANIDRFGAQGWHDTVLVLVADGTLDRARVMRSCLEALNRDFSAFRAGWFSRLYAALAPTPQEAAADEEILRLTLASSVSASAALAVKTLATVHAAGLLDAAPFVEACGPALTGSKATALTALRILVALASPADDQVIDPQAVAGAIALGMANSHADVQRAAVSALIRLGREDLAREGRDLLAPAVAADLLPGAPDLAAVLTTTPTAPADRGRLMLEAAPVRPWTEDDALERFAFLLADDSDVIELELALAWLAATPAAGAVLAPLAKRVRAVRGRGHAYDPVAELVLAATADGHVFMEQDVWREERGTVFADGTSVVEHGAVRFLPTAEERSRIPSFIARLREVAAILVAREARPLLATPTDSHGWVDPAVFVARFRATEAAGRAPLPADLAQAVLRLDPRQRADVLATFDLKEPLVTDCIRIKWQADESEAKKPSGEPMWTWWRPAIFAGELTAPSIDLPGLIASVPHSSSLDTEISALEMGAVALSCPSSTLPIVAAGISPLTAAVSEATPVGEEVTLDVLSWHPGGWTSETVQLVALGMSAKRHEIRAQAVELLVAAVPGRIAVDDAAAAFAACAPACILTRWASSCADAASLSAECVVDLLTALLPRLDRRTRGIGSLLAVLLDESVRRGTVTSDPALRAWLSEITGTSAAARAARALLRDGS